MGLFDWLSGGRRRRPARRRVQTSAQPRPRYRPGRAAQRYLERVEQLEAVQRRRKAASRPASAPRSREDDPTVEIPRSVQRAAEKAYQKRARADRQERERAEREQIRTREAERRMEARLMAKAEKARTRAIAAYMTHGATRAEAEAMADREPEYYDVNPRRRVQTSAQTVRRRGQLRTRTNPGLGAVAAEIAKDVVKGGITAAVQEELKEWRTQAHRGGAAGVVRAHRRRNPARLEPNHPDPKLREISRRFHGRDDQILHLDADQRRPPPVHVVKIGEERSIVYRPPRGSERAGADWEHEAGDRGLLRRNAGGRRILVADEHGRLYLLQGSSSMRFDPDQGLVG